MIIKGKSGRIVKSFAITLEQEAIDQIRSLIDYEPYKDSVIRIMPDAHAGKGCTVGTTMTITDKVTPNLVGVDIGCGMYTITIKNGEINLKKLDDLIHNKVPHGFSVRPNAYKSMEEIVSAISDTVEVIDILVPIYSFKSA